MLRRTMSTLAAVLLTSAMATGQQAQAPAAPKPAEAPAAATSRVVPQLVNVRIDLTITEQREGAALPPRMVSMLVADHESGRVRTGSGNTVLNVDARPELVRDGRIRMFLSLEYRRQAEETEKAAPSLLTESLAAILDDGKAVVVSQAADPTTARTSIRVEVKATISK